MRGLQSEEREVAMSLRPVSVGCMDVTRFNRASRRWAIMRALERRSISVGFDCTVCQVRHWRQGPAYRTALMADAAARWMTGVLA
jgi:hypothetical protein